jgi:hypothetical protein
MPFKNKENDIFSTLVVEPSVPLVEVSMLARISFFPSSFLLGFPHASVFHRFLHCFQGKMVSELCQTDEKPGTGELVFVPGFLLGYRATHAVF